MLPPKQVDPNNLVQMQAEYRKKEDEIRALKANLDDSLLKSHQVDVLQEMVNTLETENNLKQKVSSLNERKLKKKVKEKEHQLQVSKCRWYIRCAGS